MNIVTAIGIMGYIELKYLARSFPSVVSQKLARSNGRNPSGAPMGHEAKRWARDHAYECCGARPEGAVHGGVDGLALGLALVGPRFTWMSV